MFLRRSLQLVVVAICSAAMYSQSLEPAPQPGQGQQSPSHLTLKSNTRMVVVDVIATDSKGQTVTDLKREDFTIMEDIREQRVSDIAIRNSIKFMTEVKILP